MPGRSVTSVFSCPRITPSLRSTVTPGKLPTCWFEPVSWLNSVVLPQFWLPASANVSVTLPGSGGRPVCTWYRPPSPRPGWEIGFPRPFRRLSGAVSRTFSILIFSASASRSVSSYPWMRTSSGSPIGANFTIVTSAPGMRPMSRRCWRSAPSPPTDCTVAVFPTGSSFSVIFLPPHIPRAVRRARIISFYPNVSLS